MPKPPTYRSKITGKSHVRPPEGARVSFKEGIQLIRLDSDVHGGGDVPSSFVEDVDSLNGTLGDFTLGHEMGCNPDGTFMSLGEFAPKGADSIIRNRFRVLTRQDAAESAPEAFEDPNAGVGSSGSPERSESHSAPFTWAAHIIAGDASFACTVHGVVRQLGDGIWSALLSGGGEALANATSGSNVGLVPVDSPDSDLFVYGSVLSAAAVDEDKVSLVIRQT